MSHYDRNARRRGGKASGGIALNILIFLGGALLIIGVVIWFQKSGPYDLPSSHRFEDFDNGATTPPTMSDAEYVKRGFQPNRNAKTPPDNASNPVRPPVAPRFIGETEFKMYHRPNCKTLKYIDEQARLPILSPEEAFGKGLIPCKVCRPEVPAQFVENPSNPVTPVKPVKPLKTGEKPISLPIKDVEVSFPFNVIGRDVINERGVVRVEFEVDVQKPLMKGDVLLLAQKLVAQETAKGPINAVNLLVHTEAKSTSMLKWLCMVDWAPYGILTRAGEVKAGDYRNHSFNIYDQGFFNPKR